MHSKLKHALFCSIVLLLIIYSCGTNDSREVIQNYGTGEVSRRHTEINGKKEGKMIEYYRDGRIKGERMFENDIQVGKTIYYYPGGEIKEVQYYENGKIHGGDTVFYENGKPQFLRNFDHGVLHGYIRKWNAFDSLIYEARYAHDTLVEVKGQSVHPDSLFRD